MHTAVRTCACGPLLYQHTQYRAHIERASHALNVHAHSELSTHGTDILSTCILSACAYTHTVNDNVESAHSLNTHTLTIHTHSDTAHAYILKCNNGLLPIQSHSLAARWPLRWHALHTLTFSAVSARSRAHSMHHSQRRDILSTCILSTCILGTCARTLSKRAYTHI